MFDLKTIEISCFIYNWKENKNVRKKALKLKPAAVYTCAILRWRYFEFACHNDQ